MSSSAETEADPMPWRKQGKGYTTKRGGNVANPAQYEALRKQGKSKSVAARITNAMSRKRKKKG